MREAYGALMPGATASTSFQYQGSGTQRIGFLSGSDLGVSSSPAYMMSNYYIGVDYQLSGSSLVAPKRAKAARAAANDQLAKIDANIKKMGSLKEAEAVKIVENTFRDVNIAFANELSVIAEGMDIDVWEVIRLANRHRRFTDQCGRRAR
mgnify:CR=1 FL=1